MIAYADSHIEAAQSLIDRLNDAIFFPLITLGIAVAVLVFAWGVFGYIRNADNASAHAKGAQQMMWGIIGFVIMLSAYAILEIATRTVTGGSPEQLIEEDLPTPGDGI